jgi:hypothetical protein
MTSIFSCLRNLVSTKNSIQNRMYFPKRLPLSRCDPSDISESAKPKRPHTTFMLLSQKRSTPSFLSDLSHSCTSNLCEMTVRKVYFNRNDRTKAARCDITEVMPDVAIVYGTRSGPALDPPAILIKTSSQRILDDPTMNDDTETSSNSISAILSPNASRHVYFGSVEVIEVPSSRDDTSLWWSKMDMISTRKADRIACYTDQEVKNYLYYFEKLYRGMDESSSNSSASQESQILATGLREGFQGVERESPFEQSRQNERKQIVSSVVAAYKSSTLDGHTDDEMIRNFYLALTRKMASWAICIAQAAHLAAQDNKKLDP